MVELFEDILQQIAEQPDGRSGWLVDAEGAYYCAEELTAEKLHSLTGGFRTVVLVEPGLVYLDRNGSFNLDGEPDFYLLPASDLGTEILETAQKVSELDRTGDDLQETYLDAVEQAWYALRRNRGPKTFGQINTAMEASCKRLMGHSKAEQNARHRLGLLLQKFAGR